MLSILRNTLLTNPALNLLVFLYGIFGNLGVSIIVLTIIIRTLLIPAVLPSLRHSKKQRELQPQLNKIKKKYKNNKKKQAEAQMALFKKHGMNPASGCISMIPMILVAFALFGAIRDIALTQNIMDLNPRLYFDALKFSTESINTHFLIWDLASTDKTFVLPILAGIVQYVASKFSMGFTKQAQKVAKKTPDKSDDMAYNMQKQMLYMMPAFTAFISLQLPAGVVLYIITSSIFMAAQSYLVMGREKLKV